MRQLLQILLFFLLALGHSNIRAQRIYFEKPFGTDKGDFSRSVKQLDDGTVFLAGFTEQGTYGGFDISLVRLDRFGNEKWVKHYGNAFDNYCLSMNVCSDGTLVLTGEQQSQQNGLDLFVYRIDTAGNLLWQFNYSTPLNESGKYIEQTADGGFIICGFQNDSNGSNDVYLLNLDGAGAMQWHRSYGGPSNDYADMVHEVAGGGYIITADTKSMGAGGYDVYVIRVDTEGNIIWQKTYGDALENGCQGILVTSDGNYLSYGETEIAPASYFDFYLELIDTSGNSVWRRTIGGAEADAAFSAVETSDGFMVTGYSNSYNPGPLDLVVFSTDTAGNFRWARTYGDAGVDIGYEIIHSLDSGFLVTGKTTRNDNDDYYLLHLDRQGIVTVDEAPAPAGDFSIFPNPASDRISITTIQGKGSFTLYSMDGREVHNELISNGMHEADIGHLACGIYIAEVRLNSTVTRTKLIVSR